MRVLFIIIILMTLLSCAGTHQRGPAARSIQLIEQDLVIHSNTLKMDYPYMIYRPDVVSSEPLPVVYFLHGRGGTRKMLKDVNGVKIMKNYLERGGKPFVLVALSGSFNGKDTYWVDDARNGGLQIKTAILREIIPAIEKLHKIGGSSRNRMIAGISMGSHGSFQLSLNSYGMFKCTAGHSLVIRDYQSMSKEFPGLFGNRSQHARRDPLSLVKQYILGFSPPIKNVWIDIGGKDNPNFLRWARGFQAELERVGYDEREGDKFDVGIDYPEGRHDSPYWTTRLPEYLEWYGQCFK